MAANTTPIFPITPNPGLMNVLLTTAMATTTAYDGTTAVGTAMAQCFAAGANGSRIDSIKVQLTSTNGAAASGTTTATVIRFWMNNGSSNTTATNNQLLGEIAIPAAPIVASATATNPVYTLTVNQAIPTGYKIYAGSTAAIGGTACAVLITTNGGDY